MDSLRRPPSPHDEERVHGPPHDDNAPAKISAYYSLVFPNITFYLQTLSITIGRRCVPAPSSSSLAAETPPVDVDLGPLKSVSRLHAKIEYEEDDERFVLVVVGRNGAWVDGVWSGSGSRVPLGQRSQIQIASRTFHFVLPPPPPPDDSPSPSSYSSGNRQRSPSVDITSISPPSSLPSHSPPPVAPPPVTTPAIAPPPEPQLPNSNNIAKPKAPAKKRKKSDAQVVERPKPEDMPPKPQLTYAQLCYRAIKAMEGKATLQDICSWVMDHFDWYRYNEGASWESSIRHNLSSNRAFKKMERSSGERGKGFFWSIDEQFEHLFEQQEAKGVASANATGGGRDGKNRKKDKGIPLDPPLKRSIKGDFKGAPLPPPLTSKPLPNKTATTHPPTAAPVTHESLASPFTLTLATVKSEASSEPQTTFALPSHASATLGTITSVTPVAPDAQPSTSASTSLAPSPAPVALVTPTSSHPTLPSNTASISSTSNVISALPPSVRLPIIIGPVPSSNSSSSTVSDAQPIVLHNNTLILNPAVFSHLDPEQLRDLEALGTQKALEILQGYIVRFIKAQIRTEGSRGRGKKRGKGTAGKVLREASDASGTPTSDWKSVPAVSALATTPASNEMASAQSDGAAPVDPPATAPVPSRAESPIIVVDDDDDDEGPAFKKRRLVSYH